LLLSNDRGNFKNATQIVASALLIYLIFSHSWPIYTPIPIADQHGIRSLLLSMNFFATYALFILSVFEITNIMFAKNTIRLSTAPVTTEIADSVEKPKLSLL
jgi:hypothetical protein